MDRRSACLLTLAAGFAPAQLLKGESAGDQAGKWRIQYLHKDPKSVMVLRDFRALSAKRCVAAAWIEDAGRVRPISLVTSDAGTHWKPFPMDEAGYSMFFLDDSLGWMTTGKSIYRTEEGGLSWKRISKLPEMYQLYFLTPELGFAVGVPKKIYRTADGGKTWEFVSAAAQPETDPRLTSYRCIDFLNAKEGLILGDAVPRQRYSRFEDTEFRPRELPRTFISLATHDGGATWKSSTVSAFGQVERLRLNHSGAGLFVLEYLNTFEHTSELYSLDLKLGGIKSLMKADDIFLTDVQASSDGSYYLGAVARVGELSQPAIPAAVHILRSTDLVEWNPMPVDYKANGRRVFLSVSDANNCWAATDTGTILRWTPAS